jgi:predicted RNA binding protein YcfA (HicA-like mRNA interferase family)
MKYSELEKKLKARGCRWLRDGKRHPLWYSPVTGREFAMSYHKNEEVKLGTLKTISLDSGVKL